MTFTAFYLVVKDEFCLRESCESLRNQGVRKFFFCVPLRRWDGTEVPHADVSSVKKIVDRMGNEATLWRPSVPEAKTRAEAEAKIRNACIGEISIRWGLNRVLIVDADELWQPGTVKILDDVLSKAEIPAVTIPALSVIGVPGYPVEAGVEGLLVYVKTKQTRFTCGRSTSSSPVLVHTPPVFHFTATRKTMEETISKSRLSCHYDDPDYDFETWIRHKLPDLKPGAVDCHMYTKWQIWKRVRHFTQEEWAEIPQHLRKYLGEPKCPPAS